MAIDTAAKRKSCVGLALCGFLRMGVIPDGADLSAPQRLHTSWLYSGIAAGTPPVGPSNLAQHHPILPRVPTMPHRSRR